MGHGAVERLPDFEVPTGSTKKGKSSVHYAAGTVNMDAGEQHPGPLPLVASLLPFGLTAKGRCKEEGSGAFRTPLYTRIGE